MSLRKRKNDCLLILNHSPRMHAKKKKKNLRTSPCTCNKASLTLEAAIVIPLTAGFLVTILFFFRLLQVQVRVEEALLYTGRKVAVESSFLDTEEFLFASSEIFFRQALEEAPVIEKYVKNGSWGITLLASDFSGKEIILRAYYEMLLPTGFFGIQSIELVSQNSFRKWTGHSVSLQEEGDWVYITTYGQVYHTTTECQVLDLSIQKSTLSEIEDLRGENGQKFYECAGCSKDAKEEVVYYTDYGVLYHRSLNCSSLKRNISKIPMENVGERGPCSYCQ